MLLRLSAYVLWFCAAVAAVQPASAQEAPDDAAAVEAEAPPPLIPTSAFAGRSELESAKLSPDGARLAVIVKLEGVSRLVLVDASTRQMVGGYSLGSKIDVEWLRWAGNERIILSLSTPGEFFGAEVQFTRLALVHLGEQWVEMLGGKIGGVTGDDVIHVAEDGSYALVSIQKTIYDYPAVYRYDLVQDSKPVQIQSPRDGVWNWYADNAGVVRIGTGWLNRRLRVFYRTGPDAELKQIASLKEGDEESKFWDIVQIISGSDKGYVLQENDAGRVGLYLFDYSTREIVEPVYENPDWDVESALLRDGKPLAAFYTDDRERVVWFDDAAKKQHELLTRALEDTDIWVTSRSTDNSRMLVWAGSEADPGVLYVYTPGEKRMDQFAELRPKVDFRALARPKAVTYKARDGTTINAYLTLPRGREAKGLPLIILPHGGPFWVRDSLRYDDEVQLLANRGYAVLQPNFRGSGGYGDDFHELGAGEIGRGMQNDLDDGMDWLVGQGIADPARVCVVGGSYGGYAAMWSVLRNPERYRCAASWAGVTDWDKMLKYDRRFLSKKGRAEWEGLVEGDGTNPLDEVSPYRLAAQLSRPLLLAHGTDDSNVPFSQYKRMSKAAKKAPVPPTELVIEDEGHSFSKAENEQAWYDALEAFLAEHNPADESAVE
jgi:dipeptidyl aminopeptidase/acylaminoacyl peptidase